MDIFRGENIIEFSERFKDEDSAKVYLANLKWKEGYQSRKCGHSKGQIRKDHSRICNKCSHIESPSSGTLFHKVKFGLRKAFFIAFELSASTRGISAIQISKRYSIGYKSAWLFSHKVRKAMASSEKDPMQGNVHVDEFVIGGKEQGKPGRSYHTKKKKVVCAVELGKDDKVKRVYALQIGDYSSKSLKTIFEKHISKTALITTDEWKGYRPLMKDYSITQIPSNGGLNFKALHTTIHQLKSTLRTIYSWTAKKHTNNYLHEQCFRINRSIFKQTIFHKLVERMILVSRSLIKN